MLDLVSEMWGYSFMRRAFAATTILSISMAPVGAFLVLRRLSLAGEAMAHAITPGIVIAFVFTGLSVTSLLVGGLAAGMAVALSSAVLSRTTIIRGDASLASFYLIALALGIFILSAAGSAVPLRSFLFGSILGLDDESLFLLGVVATVTLVSFSWLLRPLIMSTCDPAFFESQVTRPWVTDQIFMVLLVLNLLGAFKTMGTLMAVGLLILPATAARCWAVGITGQIGLGVLFSLMSSWLGLCISYAFPDTPSGPAIILVAGFMFLLSTLVGPFGFGRRIRLRPLKADELRTGASV